ncbi:MAG: ABC transporter ATP-binding protein [bacterium]|nr:ABC transporter ATP-binding protein [bacterium]
MIQPADNEQAPIIRVTNLTKSFGDTKVLRGVDLDVYPGETMVIMGGSGCGKSTLLRHMIGSLVPDSGTVEMFSQDVCNMEEHEFDEVRKRFGVLFQSGALLNSLTVGENVALPLKEHRDLDAATIDIIVRIKLNLVSMRHAIDRMPSEISGGMKKRAGLARAIALDPDILFYDEPSAGLDPVTSTQIDQLMTDLSGKLGVTTLVVTHEMDSAFRIADRMCMLDAGVILKVGSREEFEAIRDGAPTGDETTDLIRQFLRGDATGPVTNRQIGTEFEADILQAGER